jgi:membrane protein
LSVLFSSGGRSAIHPYVHGPQWWQVTVAVAHRLSNHNAALLAGGIAMYGLLSVFPGLAAAVSIYGLFATPEQAIQHMKAFAGILPPGVWGIFRTQLQNVVAHDHGTLTVAAVSGLLIALWSARLTMSALVTVTSIAYETPNRRGFFVQMLISVLLTAGVIIGFIVMLVLGLVVPLALELLGGSAWVNVTVTVLRWALLWVFAVAGLNVVYHFAPARERARWRWLTWGSAVAATFWLAVSGLLTLYVRTFAFYDKTYGAFGGVVVLLMWFYLLSLFVIVGAEINAALERLHPRPEHRESVPRRQSGRLVH